MTLVDLGIPGLGRSARQLQLMPPEEQVGLDPYMATIVGYRKSGLSLNHIIGCPLDCGYCVRHFWGNFDDTTPNLLVPTAEAIEMLVGHPGFVPHITPVQVFNKATDPFLPGVRPHLLEVLHALDDRKYTNHVLVITRFKVTEADMAELEQLRHLRVTLLFTYSGITDARIEPIAKSRITVTSIRTAVAHKRRTGVVLYWRPIVPGWNTAPETMAHVLDVGRDVDGIVFTGYYHKEENYEYLRSLGVELPFGPEDFHRRKTMSQELDTSVVDAWKASGITTPLFRKTSCGVASAHDAADYNGHWGMPDLCDICPAKQQQRCSATHTTPTPAGLEAVFQQLGYGDVQYQIDDGHVWVSGLDEMRRYPVQHLTGYQIWNVDSPHFPGAHGRSLHGHTISPADRAAVDAARAELAATARFEDD
jgi:DNA repair photolyase